MIDCDGVKENFRPIAVKRGYCANFKWLIFQGHLRCELKSGNVVTLVSDEGDNAIVIIVKVAFMFISLICFPCA